MSEKSGRKEIRILFSDNEYEIVKGQEVTTDEVVTALRILYKRWCLPKPVQAKNPALWRIENSEPVVQGSVKYDAEERVSKNSAEMPMVGRILLETIGGKHLTRFQIELLKEEVRLNETDYPSPVRVLAENARFADYIREIPAYLANMGRRITANEMISIMRSYTMNGYGWLAYAAAHRYAPKMGGSEWTGSI